MVALWPLYKHTLALAQDRNQELGIHITFLQAVGKGLFLSLLYLVWLRKAFTCSIPPVGAGFECNRLFHVSEESGELVKPFRQTKITNFGTEKRVTIAGFKKFSM